MRMEAAAHKQPVSEQPTHSMIRTVLGSSRLAAYLNICVDHVKLHTRQLAHAVDCIGAPTTHANDLHTTQDMWAQADC